MVDFLVFLVDQIGDYALVVRHVGFFKGVYVPLKLFYLALNFSQVLYLAIFDLVKLKSFVVLFNACLRLVHT
jgi:hypothetical protein